MASRKEEGPEVLIGPILVIGFVAIIMPFLFFGLSVVCLVFAVRTNIRETRRQENARRAVDLRVEEIRALRPPDPTACEYCNCPWSAGALRCGDCHAPAPKGRSVDFDAAEQRAINELAIRGYSLEPSPDAPFKTGAWGFGGVVAFILGVFILHVLHR